MVAVLLRWSKRSRSYARRFLTKDMFLLLVWLGLCLGTVRAEKQCCANDGDVETWRASWRVFPTASASVPAAAASWSLETRIPMTPEFDENGEGRGKFKIKKKFKKFLLPLLLAYKLKFFTLIPVLIGGLILLTGATGLAGFFFALFAAVMGLKSTGGHHR